MGRRKERKGPQWSWKGGLALRNPRLRALALQRRGRVLRLVQKGIMKKAREASRFIHPGIEDGVAFGKMCIE